MTAALEEGRRMRWKKGSNEDVDRIVRRIQDASTVDSDGRVHFGLVGLPADIGLLARTLELGDGDPGVDAYEMVREALFRDCSRPGCNSGRLLQALERVKTTREAMPRTRFRFCGKMTVGFDATIGARRIEGVSIRFVQTVPNWAMVPEAKRAWEGAPDLESRYCVVVAWCEARHHQEAFDRVSDALSLLFGVWNLHRRFNRVSANFGGLRPQNEIRQGSVSVTVDASNAETGAVAWRRYGHQPPINVGSLGRFWESTRVPERKTLMRVEQSVHSTFLKKMLRRYAVALDEAVPARALVELWGLLEYIVGSPPSYDTVVERASFQFRNRREVKFELNRIRELRNELVHDLGSTVSPHEYEEALLGRLKVLVDHLVVGHIEHLDRFRDLEDSWRLMEMSHDPLASQERVARLQRDLAVARVALDLAQATDQGEGTEA